MGKCHKGIWGPRERGDVVIDQGCLCCLALGPLTTRGSGGSSSRTRPVHTGEAGPRPAQAGPSAGAAGRRWCQETCPAPSQGEDPTEPHARPGPCPEALGLHASSLGAARPSRSVPGLPRSSVAAPRLRCGRGRVRERGATGERDRGRRREDADTRRETRGGGAEGERTLLRGRVDRRVFVPLTPSGRGERLTPWARFSRLGSGLTLVSVSCAG